MEEIVPGCIESMSKELRNGFDKFFIEEMVPGLIHNFANPLNGIMGRSSLIQRRMTDQLKKTAYPEIMEMIKNQQTVISDIEIVNHEAERLSDILRVLSETFMVVADTSTQPINVSAMISLQMRFFEFNLEFKHNVKRKLELEQDIPEIMGSPSDYFLFFSAILRHFIRSVSTEASKEFKISTKAHTDFVTVEIGHSSIGRDLELETELKEIKYESTDLSGIDLFIEKYGAKVRVLREGKRKMWMIDIPFNQGQ